MGPQQVFNAKFSIIIVDDFKPIQGKSDHESHIKRKEVPRV